MENNQTLKLAQWRKPLKKWKGNLLSGKNTCKKHPLALGCQRRERISDWWEHFICALKYCFVKVISDGEDRQNQDTNWTAGDIYTGCG